jgi:hypothetical protein
MDVKFKLARYKLWYIDPLKKKNNSPSFSWSML